MVKKFLKELLNIVMWILYLPFYVLQAPYRYYKLFRGFYDRLFYFVIFGREIIGGLSGKVRIGTNSKSIIYQSEKFELWRTKSFRWLFHDSEGRNISSLMKMRVYNFWVDDDGYLFIKVFTNKKLIEKHTQEVINSNKP